MKNRKILTAGIAAVLMSGALLAGPVMSFFTDQSTASQAAVKIGGAGLTVSPENQSLKKLYPGSSSTFAYDLKKTGSTPLDLYAVYTVTMTQPDGTTLPIAGKPIQAFTDSDKGKLTITAVSDNAKLLWNDAPESTYESVNGKTVTYKALHKVESSTYDPDGDGLVDFAKDANQFKINLAQSAGNAFKECNVSVQLTYYGIQSDKDTNDQVMTFNSLNGALEGTANWAVLDGVAAKS